MLNDNNPTEERFLNSVISRFETLYSISDIEDHLKDMLLADIANISAGDIESHVFAFKVTTAHEISSFLRKLELAFSLTCITDWTEAEAIQAELDKIDLMDVETLFAKSLSLWIANDSNYEHPSIYDIAETSNTYNTVQYIIELCFELNQKLTTTQN